ncbi:MAG TPA: ATP-binding protein [Kofleriaceae bacterium]|nr:ATP-binding protein [Kofleriaceae bacterium]
MTEGAVARAEYELHVHGWLLRAMRAVLLVEQPEHPAAASLEAELVEIERRLGALPDGGPMDRLARRLKWNGHEAGFVWAAVALASNPRMLVHARVLDENAARGMSAALFVRIAGLEPEAARELGLAFLPGNAAARTGLLVAAPGHWVPAAVPWTPAPDLVRHLAGEPVGVEVLMDLEAPSEVTLLDAAQEHALGELRAVVASSEPLLVYVEGPALSGRRSALALASDRPVLALDLAVIAPTPAALAESLTMLRREAALRDAMPVVIGIEELTGTTDGRLRTLAQQIELSDRPVALIAAQRGLDVGARLPAVRIGWPIPDVATRGLLWRALGGAGEVDGIAQRFALGAGAIRRAVASARVLAGVPDGALTGPQLLAGIRQNIAERMGGLAEPVPTRQTWSDLVLADDVLAQVRALVGRVEHAHRVYEQWGYRTKMPRGVGVAAMFSGAPGTGKTMVAGIIARELDLELYQVDLSRVVSKWVGETEKQLAQVFDAAEAGHCLLLFDEADALFGQRSTDMKGANDRHANLEVNFLLQRIERFNGIVILTTNLEASVDKALKRRLAAHIVFQHPDEDERVPLWDKLLAADGAPLAPDVDKEKLSRLFPKMTGANIRNAALGAAFLAASERRPQIDHATIEQAARNEYRSMGHILTSP